MLGFNALGFWSWQRIEVYAKPIIWNSGGPVGKSEAEQSSFRGDVVYPGNGNSGGNGGNFFIENSAIAGASDPLSNFKYKEKKGNVKTDLASRVQLPSAGANLPDLKNYFALPAIGWNWGELHNYNAVDIANQCGASVHAAAEGLVVADENFGDGSSGWNDGYGIFVLLEHPNGTKTRYAHLDKAIVRVGDYVNRGGEIGVMGSTGNTHGPTGCHLHFEVYGAKNPFAVSK